MKITKDLVKKVLITVIGIALALLGIALICQACWYGHIEKVAQIEKFGFYKEDVIILVKESYLRGGCAVGGTISLIGGLMMTIFGFSSIY